MIQRVFTTFFFELMNLYEYTGVVLYQKNAEECRELILKNGGDRAFKKLSILS